MAENSLYGQMATARARDLPVRLAFGLFIGLGAMALTRSVWPAVWFAFAAVFQIADWFVGRPVRRAPDREPSKPRQALMLASIAACATVYCASAPLTWFLGDENAHVFALLILAGAMLSSWLQLEHTPRALWAATLPPAAYLLATPIVDGILSLEVDLAAKSLIAVGALLYLGHMIAGIRRNHAKAVTLVEANTLANSERARAEQANAAKSDFLATISHEIRTPMNAVVVAASLLQRSTLTKAQSEHVQILQDSAEVLLGLLNDVLDISKIEAGKLVLESSSFPLREKLTSSIHLWRPRAEEKGLALDLDLEGLPAHVMTDPLRFQQIVFNLLSNAIKFTNAGGVVLRGGRAGLPGAERLWVEVEDTGCGMSRETAERVFESFEQAHLGTSRVHGGTGLGLSISRRLAEMMGGGLTVESQEGLGSIFRLEVPLREAQAAPEPASFYGGGALEPALAAEILVAEDHPVNQRIVALVLEPLGYRLTMAGDGAEAVRLAAERPFDAILMDMQMPVMGGVEASLTIRRGTGPNARTPILALTANAMQEHRDEWAAVGVYAFLTKPIDIELLAERVAEASAESQAARLAA